jgi:hypothetical protein
LTFRVRDGPRPTVTSLFKADFAETRPAQPLLNWQKQEIPIPSFARFSAIPANHESPEFKSRLAERQKAVSYETNRCTEVDVESAAFSAYLFLLALQLALKDEPEIGNLSHDLSIVKFLLMCGIYSDPVSMISKLAFRILKWIIYGYMPTNDIDEPKENIEVLGVYGDLRFMDLIQEFAQDFVFSDEITPQMVNAFPLFWNFRYPGLGRKEYFASQQIEIYGEDGKIVVDRMTIERKNGETPLEHFGRYLLDEPQLSDLFNMEIRDVLEFLDKWGKEKIRYPQQRPRGERDWILYTRKVTDFDLIYFEFLRTKFVYGGKNGNMVMALDALSLIDPEFWRLKKKPPPALNGNVLWLLEFMVQSEFFNELNGPSELAKIAPKIDEMLFATAVLPTAIWIQDFDTNTTIIEGVGRVGGRGGGRRNGGQQNWAKASIQQFETFSPPPLG